VSCAKGNSTECCEYGVVSINNEEVKNKIIEKYNELGILEVSLQNDCKFCSRCWNGIDDRKWSDKDLMAFGVEEKPINIYAPWIGKYYNELKILALGINMNHYGGFNALSYLVDGAITQLAQGKRKINFGNKEYKGTFYYHRLPAYATIFLEASGMIEENRINGYPDKKDVIKAFDYIAITNSIKCSPRGGKSEPTHQMWNNCPGYILRQEIEILKPKVVLIFGKTSNYDYFKSQVLDKVKGEASYDLIKFGKGSVGRNNLEFYGITHPTAYGGNSLRVFEKLNEIVKKKVS
jgi:hypothetical protein